LPLEAKQILVARIVNAQTLVKRGWAMRSLLACVQRRLPNRSPDLQGASCTEFNCNVELRQ